MTPDEKRTGVERLAPWFHKIDLGDGVVTKASSVAGEADDHPLPTWAFVARALPGDLKGRSVLDVGCNAGFYSVEVCRRGAARVVGIDAQRREVRQAAFVARALELPIEFRRMSVYDLSPDTVGVFDVTLALGLVYHLKHLVQGLERLHAVTRDLLVLETAILLPDLLPPGPVRYVAGPLVRDLHAIGYVKNAPDAKEAVFNWFVPSAGAVAAMLEDVGFDEVDCVATPGDRAVFACRKRRGSAARRLPDLASRLVVTSAPASGRLGEAVVIAVRATNIGRSPWNAKGDQAGRGSVALGAHLFRGDEEVDWTWARAGLPNDVVPQGSADLELVAPLPLAPGAYRIEIDLVAEDLAWFEDLGSPLVEVRLVVIDEPTPMPWYRVAGIEGEVAGSSAAGAGLTSYAALVARAVEVLAPLPVEDQARAVLFWTAGWRPVDAAVREAALALDRGDRSLAQLLHALACAPDARPVPPGPPAERTERLRQRTAAIVSAGFAFSGESFPGEAAVARALLADGAALHDGAFAARAYEAVLGRTADEEGLASATRALVSRAITRSHFLRELLWSDELRSPVRG